MISLSHVSIRQGAFALESVSLEVPAGQYGVLMGKTGTGKTTLLEAICGLRSVAAGCIRLLGRDVTSQRPAASAFQSRNCRTSSGDTPWLCACRQPIFTVILHMLLLNPAVGPTTITSSEGT